MKRKELVTLFYVRGTNIKGVHISNIPALTFREAFDLFIVDNPGSVVEVITPLFRFPAHEQTIEKEQARIIQ